MPPVPPAGPPPLPPPGNPGQATWERFFWPLALVVALAYAAPRLQYCAYKFDDEHDKPDDKLAEQIVNKVVAQSKTLLKESPRYMNPDEAKAMATGAGQAVTPQSLKTTVPEFLKSLAMPLNKRLCSANTLQRHTAAFIFCNASGFWLEVLGDYCGFMVGYVSSLGLFDGLYVGTGVGLYVMALLEVCVALVIGYLLYWSVLHAKGNDYALLATAVYLVLGIVNLLYAASCLFLNVHVLRAIAYFAKAAAALGCFFYASLQYEKLEPAERAQEML